MSASPQFFKPAAPAFSPACAAKTPLVFGSGGHDDDYGCRTPKGSMIPYLREATTCPPAPRKKPPPPPPQCRKRLFAESSSSVPAVISLHLDELERLFRPHPPPANTNKQRGSVSAEANKHGA